MSDFSEYIGRATSVGTLVVERAPLTNFAVAVKSDDAVYRNGDAAKAAGFDDVPAPPTFGFAAQNWGKWDELQTADQPSGNPMAELMGSLIAKGGMILHGEQEFEYHQPLVAGQRLDYRGEVKDVYAKQSGERTMTFMVIEDTFHDEDGTLVLTSTMNLIHRV